MYQYLVEDLFAKNEGVVMTESVFVPYSLVDHIHEYLEIAYICEGIGEHILNGKKHKVRKGDVFFIARGSVHNYNAITADFRWINCLFLPKALAPDVINCENARDILNLTAFSGISEFRKIGTQDMELFLNRDEFHTLFNEMLREYREKRAGSQEILKHYLAVLCIKMFRIYETCEDPEDPLEEGYGKLILDFLEKHSLEEDIRIEDIAKKAFLSPRYFQTLFKRQTGKNVTQFLHEVRVKKACELLERVDLSVHAVMQEVGYNDTKFFYKVFKRYTGLTPGNYKRNLLDKQDKK